MAPEVIMLFLNCLYFKKALYIAKSRHLLSIENILILNSDNYVLKVL